MVMNAHCVYYNGLGKTYILTTYVLVVASPIIQGRAIVIKNKYGFLLVKTNRSKGSIISCCITIPSVTVTTNIPSCSNTDPIVVILAIETAIRLVIPIGVILIQNNVIIFTSILIVYCIYRKLLLYTTCYYHDYAPSNDIILTYTEIIWVNPNIT